MRTNIVRTSGRAESQDKGSCAIPCFKGDVVRRLRADAPDDDALQATRILFAALADTARLRLLYALKDGEELCVCDVAHVVGTSISMASHHLRKLRDLQILKYRNDGRMAYYSLKNPVVRRLVNEALRSARVVRG